MKGNYHTAPRAGGAFKLIHGSENLEASGECGLQARDDETRYAGLVLLADTQRNEVATAFQHTLDVVGVVHAVGRTARVPHLEALPFGRIQSKLLMMSCRQISSCSRLRAFMSSLSIIELTPGRRVTEFWRKADLRDAQNSIAQLKYSIMDVTRRAAARRPALIAKSYPTARDPRKKFLVSAKKSGSTITVTLVMRGRFTRNYTWSKIHAFHTTESRLAVAVEGAYLAAC